MLFSVGRVTSENSSKGPNVFGGICGGYMARSLSRPSILSVTLSLPSLYPILPSYSSPALSLCLPFPCLLLTTLPPSLPSLHPRLLLSGAVDTPTASTAQGIPHTQHQYGLVLLVCAQL